MHKRRILFEMTGASLILLVFGCCVPVVNATEEKLPNIIYIMADDLGYGELGCYGQKLIRTPHIDSIANEGIKFTQAYAGSVVCQPSRSALMTGQHTGHTAVRANHVNQYLLAEDVTVAEILKKAGYATGCFGKWGLGPNHSPGHPNLQGFDEFFGQLWQVHAHFYYPYWIAHNDKKVMLPGNENGQRKQYVHDVIHKEAMKFIRKNAERPFFAYLPYIIPHVELVVPEDSEKPYLGKFPKIAMPDPRKGYLGSEDGLTTLAGMISRLDDHVGEVLALLKELDIEENTLIIFTSDNGAQSGGTNSSWTKMTDFFKGNGPLRGYKGSFYEGGIRVPFVARWPGKIAPGTTSDHILAFWDVLPTFAEITGQSPPKNIDGISFLPTLLGQKTQTEHKALYWEYRFRNGLRRGARMGRWKAVQQNPDGPMELFDLQTDIGEQKNVAANHPRIVQEFTELMKNAHTPIRKYPAKFGGSGVKDYVR